MNNIYIAYVQLNDGGLDLYCGPFNFVPQHEDIIEILDKFKPELRIEVEVYSEYPSLENEVYFELISFPGSITQDTKPSIFEMG